MQRDHTGKPNLVDLAKAWLKRRHAKPGRVFAGMVHRLDAPVAGVIVLARTSKSAARLSAQFRDGQIRKHYLAVVHGRPVQESGRLVHRLERNGRYSRSVTADGKGQAAELTYRLLDSGPSGSLLQVLLETGRRHQIRAQLSTIGCPIVGDRAYGAEHTLADGRIALLARRLGFAHPTRHIDMTFEAPLPQGWPWPSEAAGQARPLWTIEEFRRDGLELPDTGSR